MSRKVGEVIEVKYKASGDLTNKDVKMDVFDETGTLDATQSTTMTVMNGKKYEASFTPDELGTWTIECYLEDTVTSDKTKAVIKTYKVDSYSVNSIGQDVQDIKDAIADIDEPPMIG